MKNETAPVPTKGDTFKQKIDKANQYLSRTFTNNGLYGKTSILVIALLHKGKRMKRIENEIILTDCHDKIILHHEIETKQDLENLINRLALLRDEFSKAHDHVVSECKRLNINIKERRKS